MTGRYYEVADEDCEWLLLGGWMRVRAWHGIAVCYHDVSRRRPFVPLSAEVLRILEVLAAEASQLPRALLEAPDA